jgi:hypothetical protein
MSLTAACNQTVSEMRDITGRIVNDNRACGDADAAISAAARVLGISPRRVLGILRNEVGRVWADELTEARAWKARHEARQKTRLAHAAALYEARAANLRGRIG